MDFFSIEKILIMSLILMIVLPFHEFAHGWVAYKMGDPTAKNAGRLTLNPFKHLDLLGTIMMYSVGIGWAKPVPINSMYFKNRRSGMILVSLAGPLSNLMLAFLSTFFGGLFVKFIDAGIIDLNSDFILSAVVYIALFFYILIFVNINLAIFNLIPIPPLDGSRVISAFVSEESFYRFAQYERYVGLAFIAIAALFPTYLINFISFFAKPILRSMILFTQMVLDIDPSNSLWTIVQGLI